MTVVVAYLPTPAGEAAFAAGLAESDRRNEPLLVVNSPRTGAPVSNTLADEPTLARLRQSAPPTTTSSSTSGSTATPTTSWTCCSPPPTRSTRP